MMFLSISMSKQSLGKTFQSALLVRSVDGGIVEFNSVEAANRWDEVVIMTMTLKHMQKLAGDDVEFAFVLLHLDAVVTLGETAMMTGFLDSRLILGLCTGLAALKEILSLLSNDRSRKLWDFLKLLSRWSWLLG